LIEGQFLFQRFSIALQRFNARCRLLKNPTPLSARSSSRTFGNKNFIILENMLQQLCQQLAYRTTKSI